MNLSPRRPLPIAVAQIVVRWFFRIYMLLAMKVRVHEGQNFPEVNEFGGPMLVCSNHQSNLDPLIMGCVCPFPISYLAKKSLFKFGPLGWFLSWNDSIPLDRDSGLAGMKETLKRLKRGESILIFPEGTRSRTGELLPVKKGFCTIARRAKSPVLPLAIDGAFQACPPDQPPLLGNVHVVIGKPISYETYCDWSDEELANEVGEKIAALFAEAKARRLKV